VQERRAQAMQRTAQLAPFPFIQPPHLPCAVVCVGVSDKDVRAPEGDGVPEVLSMRSRGGRKRHELLVVCSRGGAKKASLGWDQPKLKTPSSLSAFPEKPTVQTIQKGVVLRANQDVCCLEAKEARGTGTISNWGRKKMGRASYFCANDTARPNSLASMPFGGFSCRGGFWLQSAKASRDGGEVRLEGRGGWGVGAASRVTIGRA